MTSDEKQVKSDYSNGTYVIAAPLVHRLIVAIISGIVVIAGYMIVWAFNDIGWKAGVAAQIVSLEKDMRQVDEKISQGQLDVARTRLDLLERRMETLETDN